MKQTTLPGFDPAPQKPIKRAQKKQAIEAVLTLARVLDRLTGSGGQSLSPAEPKKKPHRFEVIEFPRPPDWPTIVLDFADECLAPDPAGIVNATKIFKAFEVWFLKRHPEVYPRPSQRRLGQHLRKYIRREKHGLYRYYGIRLLDQGQ